MSNLNLKNPPPVDVETHPSYGMVGLARTMNTRSVQLFGSALADHHGTMLLRIAHGERRHDLHQDHYFATDQLIEIEMSAAQFVDLITSPNHGEVPCTIRFVQGAGAIEGAPKSTTEAEKIRANFAGDVADMIQVMKERRLEIEKLTAGLPEKARGKLKIALDVMVQQLASNAPFVVNQFQEASDRVVTAAKQEIDAFTTSVLRAAGMEALAEGRIPKMLTDADRAEPRPAPQHSKED